LVVTCSLEKQFYNQNKRNNIEERERERKWKVQEVCVPLVRNCVSLVRNCVLLMWFFKWIYIYLVI
jgi:hypothetical protein